MKKATLIITSMLLVVLSFSTAQSGEIKNLKVKCYGQVVTNPIFAIGNRQRCESISYIVMKDRKLVSKNFTLSYPEYKNQWGKVETPGHTVMVATLPQKGTSLWSAKIEDDCRLVVIGTSEKEVKELFLKYTEAEREAKKIKKRRRYSLHK